MVAGTRGRSGTGELRAPAGQSACSDGWELSSLSSQLALALFCADCNDSLVNMTWLDSKDQYVFGHLRVLEWRWATM
jgi:hypothetical protein